MKNSRLVYVSAFIVVGFCLTGSLTYAQEVLDGKAVQSRLSNMFEAMIHGVDVDDQGGTVHSTFKNPSPDDVTHLREICVQTVGQLDGLMAENSFPSIPKNSRTEAELDRIFEQILRSTVFSVDRKQIRPDLLEQTSQNQDLAEYIALRLAHEIEIAKAIEAINPTGDTKTTILSQVETLKNWVIATVQKQFPDTPITSINKAVEIHFKKYELSPDSVMQVHAKRPLSESQFSELKSALETQLNQETDQAKYNYPADYPEHMKAQVEFFKVKDFVKELDLLISEPFHANLPSNFHIPSESTRYKDLKTWFEKR